MYCFPSLSDSLFISDRAAFFTTVHTTRLHSVRFDEIFIQKNVNEASAVQVSTEVVFFKFEQSRIFSFWKLLPLAENRSRSQWLKNSLIVISSDVYLCDNRKRNSCNRTFLTTQLTGKSPSYFTYVMGSVRLVLYYCYGPHLRR